MSVSKQTASITIGSVFMAIAVAVIWGFNFIMVKVGLEQLPPLTFCALRFLLASIPAIFIVPKPDAPWKYIIGYGILTFALQFSLLFGGMAAGASPGIAALIIQLQVFFAIFFAWLWMHQNITPWQIVGALVSFSGIALIALHHDHNFTWLAFFMLLASALTWGLGNIISVKLHAVNMFSLVVWSSFVAFFPLIGMAFLLEPNFQIFFHPEQLNTDTIISVLYITYGSTYIGYGCWSWLLSKYFMASIAPFALLAPIIAILSSAWIFSEPIEPWKIIATLLVIGGLCINIFAKKAIHTFSRLIMRIQKSPLKVPSQDC